MRWLLPAIVLSAPGCFPDVRIAPDDTGRDSQTAEAAPTETDPGDAGEDGAAETAPADGEGDGDGAFDPCDKDGDGHRMVGGVCGGDDCDDDDPHAHPGVKEFQTYAATPTTKGDWNCDRIVEKQFPAGFNCSVLTTGACTSTRGFADDPACGSVSPSFVTCKPGVGGIGCEEAKREAVTQGCR